MTDFRAKRSGPKSGQWKLANLDALHVSVDTVRRNVRVQKKELNLEIKKQKTPSSKGALVACLSFDDAEKLIRFYKTKGTTKSELNNNRNYGFFYLIQLIPEFQPDRVKIGFADDIDKRLKEHQTSSPTAKILAYWPCKRAWDQAAMDCVTRTDCKLVLNEVLKEIFKVSKVDPMSFLE